MTQVEQSTETHHLEKKCYTTLKLFFMVLRRTLSVACAFMLSRSGVTSWPLFLDWLLIYRTSILPPAHSAAHKPTLSLVGCSVQAMSALLYCFPFLCLNCFIEGQESNTVCRMLNVHCFIIHVNHCVYSSFM